MLFTQFYIFTWVGKNWYSKTLYTGLRKAIEEISVLDLTTETKASLKGILMYINSCGYTHFPKGVASSSLKNNNTLI